MLAAVLLVLVSVAIPAVAQQPVDADELRATAEEILAGRAYAESQPSLIERLFDWLRELFDFNLPSPNVNAPNTGSAGLGLLRSMLAVAAILALVAWATRFVVMRRSAVAARTPDGAGRPGQSNARDLDRLAGEASRRGNHKEALRLRFEAGLIRLERKGTVSEHASRTSGALSDTLQMPEFDRLAGTLDAVMYGGRPAREADDMDSASTWPVIVARAKERVEDPS